MILSSNHILLTYIAYLISFVSYQCLKRGSITFLKRALLLPLLPQMKGRKGLAPFCPPPSPAFLHSCCSSCFMLQLLLHVKLCASYICLLCSSSVKYFCVIRRGFLEKIGARKRCKIKGWGDAHVWPCA